MDITVVSLNMWDGGVLFDKLIAFLASTQADVILLQEVYNGTDLTLLPQYRSMAILNDTIHYPYQYFSADFLDIEDAAGKAERGNAILSKLPIINASTHHYGPQYSTTYRTSTGEYYNCPHNLQHVTLSIPTGSVHVFNLHGVWDMDGDSFSEARQQMSQAVITDTQQFSHVLLAGDTNAKSTNQAVRNWEPQLTSVFGTELTSTFNMHQKDNPGYATASVDMMFVSNDIIVKYKSCPDVDISDHLPLVATFHI
jgi:endonuclease/exonuclease/phosphatase family metal-dependent hydrolase